MKREGEVGEIIFIFITSSCKLTRFVREDAGGFPFGLSTEQDEVVVGERELATKSCVAYHARIMPHIVVELAGRCNMI